MAVQVDDVFPPFLPEHVHVTLLPERGNVGKLGLESPAEQNWDDPQSVSVTEKSFAAEPHAPSTG